MALYIRRPFFRWVIQHPFVPEESIKTSFFFEVDRKVTQWNVTLIPIRRQYTVFTFSLRLEANLRKDISVQELRVHIYLNNELRIEVDVNNYTFNEQTRWSRSFYKSVEMKPQVEPHEFEIVIRFTGMNVQEVDVQRNEDINPAGFFFGQEDLAALSADLDRLAVSGDYSNMTLVSDDGQLLPAHTYMIKERWENFGSLDPLRNLNISSNVLLDILRYVYSGRFPEGLPGWENPQYATELFQVIEHFQMHAFYNVFLKGENYHYQQTKKHVISHCFIVKLYFVAGQEINDESLTYLLEEHHRTTPEDQLTDLNVMFQLRSGNWLLDGGQLSVNLQSRCATEVHVQLIVERTESTTEITEENQTDFDWAIVDTFLWTLQPNGMSGTGDLMGISGPQTVGPSVPPPHFPVVYCRFNVSYTDGTTLTYIRSHNPTIQDELTRFNSLSNCMFLVQNKQQGSDLKVLYHNIVSQISESKSMHKAIFVSRVPQWRLVLSGIPVQNWLPDRVGTRSLSWEALEYVIDYMYTGKMRLFPDRFWDEITEFANAGGFTCLQNLLITRNRNRVIQ